MSDEPSTPQDRGQTLPDFAVGISIFLLTVAFVVAFIPQLTAPYQGQTATVIVDRAASDITADLRMDAGDHSPFNETCTLALFGYANATGCSFDGGDSLHEVGGVPSHYRMNVTLRDGPSDDQSTAMLCANTTADTVEACGSDTLSRGQAIPSDTHSIASTRRANVIDGTTVVLEVRVW